jgi:hypothetical protein
LYRSFGDGLRGVDKAVVATFAVTGASARRQTSNSKTQYDFFTHHGRWHQEVFHSGAETDFVAEASTIGRP